jgi:predicted nucleotidyltransferase
LTNPALHPSTIAMLKDLEQVLSAFDIDCYLVGAIARDYWLSADEDSVSKRKTDDVDIAVMINDAGQYAQVRQALFDTGKFTPHPNEAITVFYEQAIEIDLLPFGGIEGDDRIITFTEPSLFVIHMPGFAEIYPYALNIGLSDELEGIILLKLISNDDRPQRTHDIEDIEHILKVYFDLFSDVVYNEHFDTMSLYDTKERAYIPLVCARVVGRKIKEILAGAPALKARMITILQKRPTALWVAMLDGLTDE